MEQEEAKKKDNTDLSEKETKQASQNKDVSAEKSSNKENPDKEVTAEKLKENKKFINKATLIIIGIILLVGLIFYFWIFF